MKLVNIDMEKFKEGSYYIELDLEEKNKHIFVAQYREGAMFAIYEYETTPNNNVGQNIIYEFEQVFYVFGADTWSEGSVTSNVYELDETEVLKYIVMESL